MQVLEESAWRERAGHHAARIDALTAAHRARRTRGAKHPVEDFLFTYYSQSPAALRRWHPGMDVALRVSRDDDRAGWRFYRDQEGVVTLDVEAFHQSRGGTVRFVRDLLQATLDRPAQHGCFGMHEWAMVYHLTPDQLRHADWPLRLGAAGTDAVVDAHQIACSHVDAYRFFTPAASPRNALRPTRQSQTSFEQPGCLHANMDVYKWAYKLTPAIPSEVVADCFELARDIRLLDMRAAPYDLTSLGVEPIPIETKAGKATYVEQQRAFVPRSNALRRKLIEVCDSLVAGSSSAA